MRFLETYFSTNRKSTFKISFHIPPMTEKISFFPSLVTNAAFEVFLSFRVSRIGLAYRPLGHRFTVRYSLWLPEPGTDNQRNAICFSTSVPQSQFRCL
jgi:hypothetical protein